MIKKHMPVLVVCLLIVLVSLIGGAVYGINKLIPTSKQMDLTEYYGQNADGEASLVAGTQKLEQKALISGDEVYIPLDVVNGYLNQRYYWDSANKKILYATPTSLTEEAASDQPGGNVWLKESTVYLKLDYVKKYTDIDSYIYKDPARIAIQYKFSNVQTVTVKKDTVIRYRGGIKSKILTKTAKDTVLRLMNEGEDWDQVATDDGYIGYIQKKKVSAADTTDYKRSFKAEAYSYFTMDEPVNLAWHQVTSTDANNYFADTTQNMTGVNVISPTWFSVSDNDGNVSSLASGEYVMQAHEKGLKVWGLVDNFSENMSTTTVLSNTAARQNLENQLVTYALKAGLDGINVDFESLSEDVGIHFLQFLRELSIQCHENNLVLSVDNPVPEDFTSHYDRAEQGKVVDYVIIMGYDEHYVGSDAGSVASLPWVEQGVKDTLAEVPAKRTILAIPFYTRLWKTTDGGALTSEAIGMDQAQQAISDNGAETYWDKTTSQNYGTYEGDGTTYQIWLEDSKSIAEKVKLIPKYKLAGVAEWKLGFENSGIWSVITENLS
ncbi:glycosyl hydrolase family 18 protein [Blautia sp. NSJ-166]|uniref:glycosyl hydrolase family 18 protein n=1 Tax=Blautia sp. NSJ-166 TaxID=2931882 RepID=UPI000E4A7B30|nr:glycosyl hydrolase family 18 protein [Blautia sp. NSJ-166]MCJ8045687.1 glycosyl hydrolase family 18 protein [Blautia sp. NSJ-166]RGF88287.1 glycosyl hydrolase family 18 [Ruminococcus sp. OF03-6AA]RGH51833.1 glycosyl hydrolase family 18 [Ruminococcus sp. AM36-5]RGH58126.1 glycosyl hydrolase family 18 [Ruminococcus sp. AM36-2AA]